MLTTQIFISLQCSPRRFLSSLQCSVRGARRKLSGNKKTSKQQCKPLTTAAKVQQRSTILEHVCRCPQSFPFNLDLTFTTASVSAKNSKRKLHVSVKTSNTKVL